MPILQGRPGFLQGAQAPLPDVPAAVGFGLAVTVRAEHAKIFKAIVITRAIDMIQMDRQRAAAPARYAALVAYISKDALREKASLYRNAALIAKNAFQRTPRVSRLDLAAYAGLVPRCPAKSEAFHRLHETMPPITAYQNIRSMLFPKDERFVSLVFPGRLPRRTPSYSKVSCEGEVCDEQPGAQGRLSCKPLS